ncbi:MAG TPA: polyribonucleotide nucleotidyltransferase [Firmicutes bacterium]|nr:polyribonucleotide nucleotidyltransferase [Bacillota bacterium]
MEKFQIDLAGRPLILEINKVAKQANGSVMIRYGDTVLLVTAVVAAEPREGVDFLPLLVDYEERLYSVGKIPGSFLRREGRPPESAILAARATDRSIRPLFPKDFARDIQVVVTVLSVEPDCPSDTTGLIGASVALSLSEIPFAGPVAAVHVGRVNGDFVINPTSEQSNESDLDLIVAGTKDAIIMVEAGAKEVAEEVILDAIFFGHEEIKRIVAFQEEIVEKYGHQKIEPETAGPDEEIAAAVQEYATPKLLAALKTPEKLEREAKLEEVKKETHDYFQEKLGEEEYAAKTKDISGVLDTIIKDEVRKMISLEGVRVDGRKPEEIRPVTCEVGLLPRTHGSALFTRGQTQVLSIVTLGRISEEQILDGLGEEDSKRYIHHYNFPPYSVGEVRPMRSPGRRDIGHGALAERALLPVIPPEEDFPYTIRVVSEVLESNGSSSQASVCGSSLALMDAGVNIKKHVAGIAMGLIKHEERFTILSDIQGMEDHLGDMDFKVAGTKDGITAIQMDIKIAGIEKEILQQALEQARKGRLFIMSKMEEAIAQPRPDLSPYAPRMITMEIDPDRIRDVIGPGGKTIRKIIEETGVEIDIEDDGRVFITAIEQEAGEKARSIIELLTSDVEVGKTYLGKVVRLMNFGAFVEVLPGKEGLVHISQLAKERVAKVEDVVKPGDEILVKVVEIDRLGRINLSRKAAILEAEKAQ